MMTWIFAQKFAAMGRSPNTFHLNFVEPEPRPLADMLQSPNGTPTVADTSYNDNNKRGHHSDQNTDNPSKKQKSRRSRKEEEADRSRPKFATDVVDTVWTLSTGHHCAPVLLNHLNKLMRVLDNPLRVENTFGLTSVGSATRCVPHIFCRHPPAIGLFRHKFGHLALRHLLTVIPRKLQPALEHSAS
jgi:hypothetical protein